LWTTASVPVSYAPPTTTPAVANGIVYLPIAYEDDSQPIPQFDGALAAFDASGTTNCTGAPKVCSSLWTYPLRNDWFDTQPTIANNVVYASTQTSHFAYDATGTMNCSGTPKECLPIWSPPAGNPHAPAVVSGGHLYFKHGSTLEAYGLRS
jgi:hypothetical protein